MTTLVSGNTRVKATSHAAQSALLCLIKTNVQHVEDFLRHGCPKAAASLMPDIAAAAAEYHRLATQPIHEQTLIDLLAPAPDQAEIISFSDDACHSASLGVQAAHR
jgi:hypothetical protein